MARGAVGILARYGSGIWPILSMEQRWLFDFSMLHKHCDGRCLETFLWSFPQFTVSHHKSRKRYSFGRGEEERRTGVLICWHVLSGWATPTAFRGNVNMYRRSVEARCYCIVVRCIESHSCNNTFREFVCTISTLFVHLLAQPTFIYNV